MNSQKRNTALAGHVRFYYPMILRTCNRISTGDGAFIEKYIQERDKDRTDNDVYHKLYYFEYEKQLYASNEELINAAINRSESDFEDWYFEDYLLNKSKYKSILIKN